MVSYSLESSHPYEAKSNLNLLAVATKKNAPAWGCSSLQEALSYDGRKENSLLHRNASPSP